MYFAHVHPPLPTLPRSIPFSIHPILHLHLVCLDQIFLDVWSSTRVWLTSQGYTSRENRLSLSQPLAVANSSMVRSGIGCPTPSPCQDLVWAHAVVTTVCSDVQLPAVSGREFPCTHSLPPGLIPSLPSL